MNHIQILIIDDAHPVVLQKFAEAGFSVTHNESLSVEEVHACIHLYDAVILRSKIIADKEFIDKGIKLRCIGRVGAGMETIDIPYAESKGISCINSPEGNRDAVGEQTIGVLLALMNNITKADKEVRNLLWDREGNRGIELKGRTVGIIGYGNMGGAFAQKLSGFECTVLAYDKYKTNFSDSYVTECTLEELQNKADIISLHVPQTPETIGMINSEFIAQCTKPFILLNTARGKVVQTDALVQGMKLGKVIATGLDVLEYESYNFQDFLTDTMPEAFNYLAQSQRVILTPHIAGWTVESKYKLSAILADKIIAYFNSKK